LHRISKAAKRNELKFGGKDTKKNIEKTKCLTKKTMYYEKN
jgi:hypothetical protein